MIAAGSEFTTEQIEINISVPCRCVESNSAQCRKNLEARQRNSIHNSMSVCGRNQNLSTKFKMAINMHPKQLRPMLAFTSSVKIILAVNYEQLQIPSTVHLMCLACPSPFLHSCAALAADSHLRCCDVRRDHNLCTVRAASPHHITCSCFLRLPLPEESPIPNPEAKTEKVSKKLVVRNISVSVNKV